MAENAETTEELAALKRQLAVGEYQTLIHLHLDVVGRLVQRLTRRSKPLPYWASGVVFALFIWLVPLAGSLFYKASDAERAQLLVLETLGVWLTLVGILAIRWYVGVTFSTLRNHVADTMQSPEEIADLRRWLTTAFDWRRSLAFCVVFLVLVVLLNDAASLASTGRLIRLDVTLAVILSNFQLGISSYLLLLYLALPLRLSRYHLKLFSTDPSSSEVVYHLGGMFNRYVYLAAALQTLITLFWYLSGLATPVVVGLIVVLGWGPITALFLINQYALAKIITTAKWSVLNGVQRKIESLQAQQEIPDESTLAHLNKLMDYHDRIKATRNSALDFRAGLSFVNSLLIPLVAFLISNLDTALAFFGR